MNSDNRIVELLTDMLHEQKNMLHEQKKTNERLEKLEKQQAKINNELSEMRLALIKFAEQFFLISKIEERVLNLEKTVFQH